MARYTGRSPLADALALQGELRCTDCGVVKPLAAFPVRRSSLRGCDAACRACHSIRMTEYRTGAQVRRTASAYASPNALPVCGGCGHLGAGSYGVPDPVRAGDRLLWLCEPCYKANREALDAVTE